MVSMPMCSIVSEGFDKLPVCLQDETEMNKGYSLI